MAVLTAALALAQDEPPRPNRPPPPLMTIAEAIQDSNGDTIPDRLGTRVHVRGVVTIGSRVVADDRLQVYFQDQTAGTYAFSMRDAQNIPAGSVIDVVGIVDQYRGAIQINRPTISVIGRAPLPAPRERTVAEAASWKSYGKLVEVEGTLGAPSQQGPYVGYDLTSGRAILRVMLPPAVMRNLDVGSIPDGARVAVVGVVSIYSMSPPHETGFQLLVGSPSWIEVRSRPVAPWLQQAAVAVAVIIPAGIALWFAARLWRRQLASRKRHVETLNVLGAMAAGARDADTFLSDSMELMMRNRLVDSAVIHLIDGSTLRLHASYGVPTEQERLVDEQVRSRIAGRLSETDFVITDPMTMGGGGSLLYPLVCVPLQGRTRSVGVVTAFTTRRHAVTPAEAATIAAAANLIALGIENVQMMRESDEKQRELEQLAITDTLTGLYNRRFMDEYLRIHMAMARRQNAPISFIAIDLDHFKRVNDTWGHESGDAVLAEVGQLIRNTARASDLPVRSGGEEFLVLMPDTGEAGALTFAHRLQAALREQTYPGLSDALRITASIGVAIYPDHGSTVSQLLRVADESLYDSKRAGRDRITLGGAGAQFVLER